MDDLRLLRNLTVHGSDIIQIDIFDVMAAHNGSCTAGRRISTPTRPSSDLVAPVGILQSKPSVGEDEVREVSRCR